MEVMRRKTNKQKVAEGALEKQIQENMTLSHQLQQLERTLSDIEKCMHFINERVQKGWQLYGLEKFEDEKYLIYFLECQFEEDPQYAYNYNLYAYVSSNLSTPVYKALLEWKFDSRFDVKRRLYIESQYINDKNMQGHGIGTASIEMIKKIAKQLQCDSIDGLRRPLNPIMSDEEKEKESEKLYKFYEKNGFVQSQNTDRISIPLKRDIE